MALPSIDLEQLRYYDAAAIARYYRPRPWKPFFRALWIVWSFVGFVWGLLWDRSLGLQEQNQAKRAQHLRKILTRLGPTFIKVGQALSTRPDLVKPDFLEELIKLQDQLPPFASDRAFDIIEQELGLHLGDAYREISPVPVAAASLGQVYKAVTHQGETVAVKVQRPNLVPTLTLDLLLIRWGAGWLAPWLPLNLGHDLQLIVDEFGTKLFEEIDYVNEGRNAERFAANFASYNYVKVPKIYWRYTTPRLLTLEWIEGCKLTLSELKCFGLDPDATVRIGVVSGLQQLLEFGFFHADPHPGNLFALAAEPDSGESARMAFIDFGMMDQLEESTKETLVDAVVHLINQDYSSLARDFIQLGFLAPGTDIGPLIPAIESVLGDIMGESVRDFNFKTITDRFSELMYDYPFRVPAKFALIIRSLVTQEGLALSVNPDFKIVEVAYPYVAKRLLEGESPALRRRLLEVLFKDGTFRWERLENLILIARSEGNFDLLPTAQMGFQFLMSEEGAYIRRQLLLALIEDDRLHTAEVQRLWDLVKGEFEPARLWDTAWESAVTAIADFSRQRVASLLPSLEVS
jgi:predicted unusual protein kinase regulating ubiquinone biosynthesis (AarF/ABC1/UbiB family)